MLSKFVIDFSHKNILYVFFISVFIRIYIYFQLLRALGNMSQTTEASADAAVNEGLDFFCISLQWKQTKFVKIP